jgi:hypothetical protein
MLSSFAAGNHQPSDSGSQKSIVRNDSPGPLKMTVTKLQYSLVKNCCYSLNWLESRAAARAMLKRRDITTVVINDRPRAEASNMRAQRGEVDGMRPLKESISEN